MDRVTPFLLEFVGDLVEASLDSKETRRRREGGGGKEIASLG
jgi:hypothetical protein